MTRKNEVKNQILSIKWVLLICLGVLFVSCSNVDERKNWELNGNIKSSFERLYEVEKKFGKWENGDIEYYGHSRVTFDKKGQYIEIENYDDDMDLTGKLLPVREKGKVLEEAYYDEDGDLRYKTVFVYKNGKAIEEIYYDSDGKSNGKSIVNHISKNELTYELFDSDGMKTAYGKHISKDGKIVKQIYTRVKDGVDDEVYTTVFEYDKNGNKISQKRTNKKGEIDFFQRFEYLEFDAKKNWTRRLMYEEDDDPENIAIREIEYY